MDVRIDEVVSHVLAVDDQSLLTPEVMRKIVRAVLEAVEEREAHGRRVDAERLVMPSAVPGLWGE